MSAQRRAVFLHSFAGENPTLRRLRRIAALHPPATVDVVDDLRAADTVLHVENGYAGLREAMRGMRGAGRPVERFIFSESDWPYPFLPGLFPSLTRRLPWAAGWSYLLPESGAGPDPDAPGAGPRYLFSFAGRLATHGLRQRIARLDTPETPCFDVATADTRFPGWDYRRSFVELLRDSRFVLCPRGIGASSIRVFEAMRLGRVPVIVSDAWIAPPVGDWSRFSLRVPEARVAEIPDLCRANADRAAAMGREARAAYEAFFAPERFLDAAIAQLMALRDGAKPRAMMAAAAVSLREFRSAASDLVRRRQ